MINLAGGNPKMIKTIKLDPQEYCNILYLPIYIEWQGFKIPKRVMPYLPIIKEIPVEYNYMYITIKHQYVEAQGYGNRPGWHVDGFLSNNKEYVWCSREPTEYISISEYEEVAEHETALENFNRLGTARRIQSLHPETLYFLGKTIHRTPKIIEGGVRTFVKISCSNEKFNLKGNAVNELLKYKWKYYDREITRNHPTHS